MHENVPRVQLLFESQQKFLLAGVAPDIPKQIAMSRAHVFQRCFAIQVLRAGSNVDSLVIIGIVGLVISAEYVSSTIGCSTSISTPPSVSITLMKPSSLTQAYALIGI